MLRKLLVGVALLGLFPLVGCALVPPVTTGVEKGVATVEAGATTITHGDSSLDHYRAHYQSYYRNIRQLGDYWDYHFFAQEPDAPPVQNW